MRLFIVDTAAAVLFFTIAAAISELFIAGLDPRQVLLTRLLMIPVIALTGRPYGIWRDRLFRFFRPRRQVAMAALDIGGFLSFQAPVYVLMLAAAGASPAEIGKAVSSAVVLMVLLSRPFGLFIEFVRRLAGVPAA